VGAIKFGQQPQLFVFTAFGQQRSGVHTGGRVCPQICITPIKSATIRALHSDRKDFAP
jgi:hypothetical protein